MDVVVLDVPSLGNRTHLVHDGTVALVVDPPRDLDAVERAAEAAEVDVVAVADTHVHNDYVSGAPALARRHGADHLLSADEHVGFERVGVRDGDVLGYGSLEITVVDTPGHTRHHQAFAVSGATTRGTAGPREPGVVLSGGSLLHGSVGRTDLVDRRLARHLAEAQWTSARHLARLLPGRTAVLPTHGFGSFCAATSTDATEGTVTLDDEQHRNPALLTDRAAFVEDLVAGFGPIPRYYAHMGQLNRRGAGAAPGRPARPVTAGEVELAVASGAWVIDLRDRGAYARGHLPGTIGVEHSAQAATYVGWVVPWGEEIVLLADTHEALADAGRDLARIGIEGVGTHLLDAASPLPAHFRRTDWAEFRARASRGPAPVVVDVRQRAEFLDSHLPAALHLPVQDAARFGATLPPGELWVHCRSGYRAGIAASVLHRMGREVVHVDDDWDRIADLAVPTTTSAA